MIKIIKKHIFFYLAIIVFLLVEISIIAMVLPPQISNLIGGWQDLMQVSKDVNELNGVNIALTTQDKASIEPYLIRASASLPDEKKSAGFISGFTRFAAKYGVSVITADFSPGLVSSPSAMTGFLKAAPNGDLIVVGGVKAISISVSVVGDPTSIKTLFDEIEKASQLIDITEAQYYSADKGNNSAKISMLVYFQPVNPSTIKWEDVKTLNEDDINFLGALPTVDQFKLLSE
ncbi:hypothetical protein HY310_00110 [Candidatus Microgenomates bacterium]|nr:hypothetical protein [Candidatus Microgenomates bacterium]